MPSRARSAAFTAVAVVAAVASLTVNFGIADLVDGFSPFVDEGRNRVLDAGWGAIFGIVLPLGLLAQIGHTARRVAGLQQTYLVALALAAAGAAAGKDRYLVLAGLVGLVCVLLTALHPSPRSVVALTGPRDPALVVAAAVAALPFLAYARRTISAARDDLPPADAVSNGMHHWTAMAALALLVLLLVLLAGLGSPGRWIPLVGACVAAAAWAVSCLIAPAGAAGSEGHAWAALVLVWSAATLAVGLRLLQVASPAPGASAPPA